jgi:regulator of nonsense transcripts 1
MRSAQRVVLIGDHMQLPPTILSTQARDDGYAMSLFEKLVLAHQEWSIMLDVQRRMHPCIAAFPGRAFYGDRIRSADCTWDEAFIDGFKWPNGNRVVCVNSNGWEERRGVSSINRDEAYAVAALIPRIQLEQDEIGIITPYLAQKNLILELLAKHHNMHDIKVDTVDGFQGSEREMIVYSCVRSNERGALGFLSDYRRLNVAITRARKGLVVLGNIATLNPTAKRRRSASTTIAGTGDNGSSGVVRWIWSRRSRIFSSEPFLARANGEGHSGRRVSSFTLSRRAPALSCFGSLRFPPCLRSSTSPSAPFDSGAPRKRKGDLPVLFLF